MGAVFAVIGAAQAVTAVSHGVLAVKSFDQCDKFKKLAAKIEVVVQKLSEIKNSLEPYENAYMQQVHMWDVQQTVAWVKGKGAYYNGIGILFEQHNIKGDDLADMDHDTLKELGVSSNLKRKRLLRKIRKLLANN